MKDKNNRLPYWFHGLLVGFAGIGLLIGVIWKTNGLDMPLLAMIFTTFVSFIGIMVSYCMIKDWIMAQFKPDEYYMPKGRFEIKNTLFAILAYSVGCIILVSFFGSFAHEYESKIDAYPYHNAETLKGQYEYGGSIEQQRQLKEADFYLTEDEYQKKR